MKTRKIKVNTYLNEQTSNEQTSHGQKKLYSIVCSKCKKSLGKTEEIPNVVVCVNCYYQAFLVEPPEK